MAFEQTKSGNERIKLLLEYNIPLYFLCFYTVICVIAFYKEQVLLRWVCIGISGLIVFISLTSDEIENEQEIVNTCVFSDPVNDFTELRRETILKIYSEKNKLFQPIDLPVQSLKQKVELKIPIPIGKHS